MTLTHTEGMVLFGVHNLQQRSSGVSMEINLPNLVNLILKKKKAKTGKSDKRSHKNFKPHKSNTGSGLPAFRSACAISPGPLAI